MVGFYDDLITDRPTRIQDLWPSEGGEYWQRQTRLREAAATAALGDDEHDDNKQPECILAEYMDVWASSEEILELLQDKTELEHIGNVFSQAARQVIETCKLIQDADQVNDPTGGRMIWLTSCKGCNRQLDVTRHEIDGGDGGTLDFSGNVNFCSFVHLLLSVMGVINHLLLQRQTAEHSCDLLVLVLTPQPTNGQALEAWRRDRCMYHDIWIVERLILLLRHAAQHFPKVGYAASTMLSLLMARRPAACLASIADVDHFGDTVQLYLKKQIVDEMEAESFLMHRYCGMVAFVRIMPLLFHINSWGALTTDRRTSMFSQMIAVLGNLVKVRKDVDQTSSIDARYDLVEPLYPVMDECQLSVYAIAAALEILGRLIAHGAHMQDRPAAYLRRPVNCKQEIDDIIKEYKPHNVDLGFLLALLECCHNPSSETAQNDAKRILAENEDKLFLSGPLLQSRMRCGLPTCRATQPQGEHLEGESQQNLPKCSGGCKGMELYCCREHQREHWRDHKRFCKASK